jgi:hypothetical protein
MLVWDQVGDLVDIVGDLTEFPQLFVGEAAPSHLQLEAGDDGAEVGVAAPLPEAVDGPLHMDNAVFHRDQGVGHGTAAVVVGVDPQRSGDDLPNLADDGRQLLGEGTAIGVTQHQAVGPGLLGRLQGFHGIFGIGPVAVEKMFGVVDDLPDVFLEEFQGIEDHLEVFFKADSEGLAHMEIPGLAEDGDGVRFGLNQGAEIVILIRRGFGPPRSPERGDLGLFQVDAFDFLEEGDVFGIGSGPAPFDVVDPQFIELFGNADLVGDQESDILGLRPVAQGGVVQLHRIHDGSFVLCYRHAGLATYLSG